jgi:hypothetical protein
MQELGGLVAEGVGGLLLLSLHILLTILAAAAAAGAGWAGG